MAPLASSAPTAEKQPFLVPKPTVHQHEFAGCHGIRRKQTLDPCPLCKLAGATAATCQYAQTPTDSCLSSECGYQTSPWSWLCILGARSQATGEVPKSIL